MHVQKSRLLSRLQLPPVSAVEKRAIAHLLAWSWHANHVPADAAGFVKILEHHRLLGVLEYCAGREPKLREWLQRADVMAELVRAWERDAAQIAAIAAEWSALQAIARRAGVAVFPLKGAHLGSTCYPTPRARPMDDLDVLVAGADLAGLIEALFASGYRVIPDQERNGPSRNLHYDQLAHPERGVVVEVHHHVARGLGLEALDRPADALPPHFHFLHRLLEIAKDGPVRKGILPYFDLLQLGRTYAALELDEVAELADRTGSSEFSADAYWHFLQLCAEIGAPVPDRLVGAHAVRSRFRRALRRLHGRSDGLWRIRYVPRWQRRMIAGIVGTVG
jgi:hypothetical protein